MDNKQNRYDTLYLDLASRIAKMSHARRLQVGALAVKDNNIISFGFNGTPTGFDNNCEDQVGNELKTKPEVIHAEGNLISKAAREGLSLRDSTVYLTHSPCSNCSLLLIQSGISKVVYKEDYRSNLGIELLNKSNIKVEKL